MNNERINHILNHMCRLQLVSFGEKLTDDQLKLYPFSKGEILLMLGEIENMPGHCVVVTLGDGRIHVGYHIEHFRILSIDET